MFLASAEPFFNYTSANSLVERSWRSNNGYLHQAGGGHSITIKKSPMFEQISSRDHDEKKSSQRICRDDASRRHVDAVGSVERHISGSHCGITSLWRQDTGRGADSAGDCLRYARSRSHAKIGSSKRKSHSALVQELPPLANKSNFEGKWKSSRARNDIRARGDDEMIFFCTTPSTAEHARMPELPQDSAYDCRRQASSQTAREHLQEYTIGVARFSCCCRQRSALDRYPCKGESVI